MDQVPVSEISGTPAGSHEKHHGNSAGHIPSQRIYVYNMNEDKTPGRLKVRIKIRVITGPEAARLDARQTAAIMELLKCAQRNRSRPHGRPARH
jgi:hypothetical protein